MKYLCSIIIILMTVSFAYAGTFEFKAGFGFNNVADLKIPASSGLSYPTDSSFFMQDEYVKKPLAFAFGIGYEIKISEFVSFDIHAGIDFYLSSVFFVEFRAIIGLQSIENYVDENTIIDSDDIFGNSEGPYGKKTYLFTYSDTNKVEGKMELRSLYFMLGTRY